MGRGARDGLLGKVDGPVKVDVLGGDVLPVRLRGRVVRKVERVCHDQANS